MAAWEGWPRPRPRPQPRPDLGRPGRLLLHGLLMLMASTTSVLRPDGAAPPLAMAA